MNMQTTISAGVIVAAIFFVGSVSNPAAAKVYKTDCKSCFAKKGICYRSTCATRWKEVNLSKRQCKLIKTKKRLRFWGSRSKLCFDGK